MRVNTHQQNLYYIVPAQAVIGGCFQLSRSAFEESEESMKNLS